MAEQVFYRKWRPQRFQEVVGQEHITTTLLNALSKERVAHAYLLCGPRGTGKTSTGRILAKAICCLKNGKGEPCNECHMCQAITEGRAMDLIEIDAASNRGIDEIRSLREKVNFAPNEARKKVYIIDEVHMLTTPAFNALLKTLEEPPPHSIFVLATTEAHKLPATVISRCQRFDFRRIPRSGVIERLSQICQAEGVEATTEALGTIARLSGGSLRDAENLLEQLVVGTDQIVDDGRVRELLGIGGDEQVRALTSAIFDGDVGAGLTAIAQVASEGFDLFQFHRELMERLRNLMLIKAGAIDSVEATHETRNELEAMASKATMERIVHALRCVSQADLRSVPHSTLPLELALVEALSIPTKAAHQEAERPVLPVETPAAKAPGPRPTQPARQPGALPRQSTAPSPAPPASAAPANGHEPTAAPKQRETPPPVRQPAGTASEAEAAPVAEVVASSATEPSNGGPPRDPAEQFALLRDNWRTVVEASRGRGQKYKLDALLRGSRLVSIEDDTAVLGFTHQKFVDMMEEEIGNPGSRLALEEALAQVLGQRLQVRCVLRPPEGKARGGHLMKAAISEHGARAVSEERDRR